MAPAQAIPDRADGPSVFSRKGEIVKEFSGGVAAATTNNRMELTAVPEAVGQAPKGNRLEIHTRSKLVVGWLSEGWKRKEPTVKSLCAEIDALMAQRGPAGAVSFRHIRGHNADALNERADFLATAAIEKVRRRPTSQDPSCRTCAGHRGKGETMQPVRDA
jgi:ribonuclease HI